MTPALLPSTAELSSGNVPTLLVHKSYQGARRLPEVFATIAGLYDGNLGVGTVVPVHNHKPNQVRDYMGANAQVPLRLLDPELHYGQNSAWEARPEVSPATNWSYFADIPLKAKGKWVRRVLDAQTDHGATVLLSASGWVDMVDASASIATAMGFVAESREQSGDRAMWVNLTMDSRWLSDQELRDKLLKEIVESKEKSWYLRFFWPEVPVRYGQLADSAVLAGYKELAEVAALEDKHLYLPNTGLTGWIATALGATGFSTGQAWPEQAFAKQRIIRGRRNQPPPPRIPRFFDSHLLHTVERSEFERLRELDDHVEFETPFSIELDEEGYSPEVAGLHYLIAVAELQSKLVGRRPEARAKREVKAGVDFLADLPRAEQPAGMNRPTHLTEWQGLL